MGLHSYPSAGRAVSGWFRRVGNRSCEFLTGTLMLAAVWASQAGDVSPGVVYTNVVVPS
ncbi:MAG: hypothetical protein U1F83_08995 [Verrucomicrobiota bacterium]